MAEKPTYKELEKRIKELEQTESNHKRIEEQLCYSPDLLDYVISHARSAIAIHDRDLKYIYVSKRYLRDYKVKKQNVIGKHHYEVFPDLPQKWRDVHQRSLAGEVLSAEEDPYYRENGSVDWTRWECRPWYETDGSIGGIIIYTEVITKRKKIEESLKISEQRLDLAIKAAGIGLWDWYFQTGEAVFNEQWAQIVGYKLEELSPVNINTWIDLCHPDDLEKSNKLLEEHFASKTDNYICETRMKHKDGHWVWVLNRGKVFEWSKEGKPLRATGIHLDISANKRIVSELKKSEEQYRSLINNIQAAVVVHDVDTRVIACNPKSHELLGLTQNQIIGRQAFDSKWNFLNYNANKMPLEQYPVNQVLTTQQQVRNQTIGIFRPDKDDFVWVLVSADPVFDVKGKIQQVIVTFMDITELKKMEKSLHESEEKYRSMMESMKDASYI
jgi:PAS domain S-box-containing protein